ncbi:RNA-binding S4 domain-containing protein [Sporanaerobacter acetigenes]|uniref:Ribosome-associated protein n=1 Tax=Sporanaerobacter acetigenes DSM 13106 TaxID=1123281 RepID=A0A1M5YTU6_9FIRM|nr:RNA-binding S4 domain-containing protein [Sporanaerobacter acetigenes]SHI15512.1 ribosome-associated protein [Sporanaerobacter acetigenes DSM 13106]
MKKIKIDTEYIKLDQFLKYIGVVQTGGQGKILIEEKKVEINGEVVTERGKKIRRGDKIKIKDVDDFVVI